MLSIFLRLAALAAIVVFLLVALTWLMQERVAFQPPGPPYPDPGNTRRLDYAARDGQKLFAFLVGDSLLSRGLLISFHGNADLAVWQIPWAEETARRAGVAVMLAEYRGYMGEGSPSYSNSRLDAEAAYLAARNSLRVAPERIAFFGHSLGTGVAAELALEHTPAALLLQSPFTSARDMARAVVAKPVQLAWGVISRFHFDTERAVARISAPVWVAHGARDRLIPLRMGERVFQAARVKGRMLVIPDAGHNDVVLEGGNAYWEWLRDGLSNVPHGELTAGILQDQQRPAERP